MTKRKYEEKIAALQAEILRLQKENTDLLQYREHEKLYKEEAILSNYEYAILLDEYSCSPKIWNNGRFEMGVREVDFHAEYGYVPELTIKK